MRRTISDVITPTRKTGSQNFMSPASSYRVKTPTTPITVRRNQAADLCRIFHTNRYLRERRLPTPPRLRWQACLCPLLMNPCSGRRRPNTDQSRPMDHSGSERAGIGPCLLPLELGLRHGRDVGVGRADQAEKRCRDRCGAHRSQGLALHAVTLLPAQTESGAIGGRC